MIAHDSDEIRVPILEERVRIDRQTVETDHVRVRTVVEERHDLVDQVLETGRLDVDRIAFDTEVATLPAPRQDGETLIVSVVEERLVKRLFLIEEVHITRSSHEEAVSIPVSLRHMRAVVEREGPDTLEQGDTHG